MATRERDTAIVKSLRQAAKGLLAEHGVTQAQLAERFKISPAAVSQMLNTRVGGLTVDEMLVIEQTCKVPMGTLLDRLGLVRRRTLYDCLSQDEQLRGEQLTGVLGAIDAAKRGEL